MSRKLAVVAAVIVVGAIAWFALRRPFPGNDTPEGAYVRVALALQDQRPREVFPYLETEAQWACFTTRDLRRKAVERARASYPETERAEILRAYEPDAVAPDGADVFVRMAKQRGWLARLRRDLSGVVRVDVEGERASVVTARGTRYPFRRRDNGMWGLTMFTAELQAEAERAARDLDIVEAAAADFDRARTTAR